MLRPIAVHRYLDTLHQHHGIEPRRLLQGTSLSAEQLARPDALIDPVQARLVVGNLLKLSGDQGVGLDVWMNTPLPRIGVIGHATLTSPCVREVYPLWRRHGRALVGLNGSFCIVEESEEEVTFAFDGLDPLDPFAGFYTEELMGIFALIGEQLVGEAPVMRRAAFAYREPAHAERYQRLLGDQLRFGAERTSITLNKDWLVRPIGGHDPDFHQLCRDHCQTAQARIEGQVSSSQRVRALLEQAQGPWPTLDEVAQVLNVSARTLRRRLQDEQTSFLALVEALRRERACDYLSHTDLPVKDVAYRLGFDEVSSFRHAFKQWTGQAVGEYRQQAQT